MSLKALSGLFVISWCAWACMPLWGGVAYGALEVMLLVGSLLRSRQARTRLPELQLSEAARAFSERYALFYVDRPHAKEWAGLLRAVALGSLGLLPVFAVQALIRVDPWLVLGVPFVGIIFLLNALVAPRFEVDEWTKDEGRDAELALHREIASAMASRVLSVVSGPPALRPPGS